MPKKSFTPRSDDAVPADFIRLSDSFRLVLEAAEKKPKILEAIPEWAHNNLSFTVQALQEEEKSLNPESRTSETKIKAACLFRIALYEELETFVWDPERDQLRTLNSQGWFFCDERVPTDFENWVSDDLTPGPAGTDVGGKRRPVILRRKEFETWISERIEVRRKPRKKRAGSYEIADAPIVEKMRDLIDAGKAKSPKEAASHFVADAKGASLDAKLTRLSKRYCKKFPD